MQEYLKGMILGAVAAGAEAIRLYKRGKVDVEYKKDGSPLTEADKRANEVIIEHLSKFKDIPFLSEESSVFPFEERRKWKRLWIIDPIDGTKGFIERTGEFTINIGLVEGNQPVAGVVYAPAQKLLYFGAVGFGARLVEVVDCRGRFILPEKIMNWGIEIPREVGNRPFRVVASKHNMDNETEEFIGQLKKTYQDLVVESFGSSLKLCKVAEGEADIYPRMGSTSEWDIAAAHAIVKASGFDVWDLETAKPIFYNRKNLRNGSFIVAEESLIIQILNRKNITRFTSWS